MLWGIIITWFKNIQDWKDQIRKRIRLFHQLLLKDKTARPLWKNAGCYDQKDQRTNWKYIPDKHKLFFPFYWLLTSVFFSGRGRSKSSNELFVLGLQLNERFIGREWNRRGFHLFEAPKDGNFGWFGHMLFFLTHGRSEVVSQVTELSEKKWKSGQSGSVSV